MKKDVFVRSARKHAAFFRQLAETENQDEIGHIVSGSSPQQLETLLTLIHYVVTGVIPISREIFEAHMVGGKKLPALRQFFERSTSFRSLRKFHRAAKLRVLRKILRALPFFARVLL
jgi:hypothetical protein